MEGLLYRYLVRRTSGAEDREVYAWLEASEKNRSLFFEVAAVWSAHRTLISPATGERCDAMLRRLNARIDADDEQLRNGHGYDHNWVLGNFTGAVRLVASLYDPASGRRMEILTDQPGMQFYSGNFFNDGSCGKFGRKIGYRGAVALETQHFPDAPNHLQFPSTLLRPGETYTQTCIYRFCVCP